MSRIMRSESVRQGRIPVASNRAPLVVKGLDQKNFSARWVANIEGRLEDFLDGGYEFVTRDQINGRPGETTVDSSKPLDNRVTKSGGRGITLYLMRLPREFFEEDQKAKEKEIDLTIEAMSKPSGKNADYGKITIETKDHG